MSLSTQELRQHFRQKRRQLGLQAQHSASSALLSQCLTNHLFTHKKQMAFYIANDGEIDPRLVIEYCWEVGIKVCLPVIDPQHKQQLLFVPYHSDSLMINNKFGIPEPDVNFSQIVPLHSIDHIFLPLVAFDQSGSRLGMGGGFYDRTLQTLFAKPIKQKRPMLTGLAHDCQQAECLQRQSWDIPLDQIITPSQIFDV